MVPTSPSAHQSKFFSLGRLLSILLAYVLMVNSSCQFPEFLLLPNTNIWWSGPAIHWSSQQSGSSTSFAQLTVRGDLRKMILSYSAPSVTASPYYSTNQFPYIREGFALNYSSTSKTINVYLECEHVADKSTGAYVVEVQLPKSG